MCSYIIVLVSNALELDRILGTCQLNNLYRNINMGRSRHQSIFYAHIGTPSKK